MPEHFARLIKRHDVVVVVVVVPLHLQQAEALQ
jgi:hypothetical protein